MTIGEGCICLLPFAVAVTANLPCSEKQIWKLFSNKFQNNAPAELAPRSRVSAICSLFLMRLKPNTMYLCVCVCTPRRTTAIAIAVIVQ